MALFEAAERPVRRSRVHGGRKLLLELCRLKKKFSDAYHVRAKTEAERMAYLRIADSLDAAIELLKTLNFPVDPRETRRVRKRKDTGT